MGSHKIRVVFLGTAGSTFTEDNTPPCIYVEGFLLDCSASCPQRLLSRGLLGSLHSILLTHLHLDHSLGVYELAWHLGTVLSKQKLYLYLPAGEKERLEEAFAVLGGRLSEKLLSFFEVVEVEPNYIYGRIKVVYAQHSVKAVGYRLDFENASICYTGDTAPTGEIVKAFRDCSILIHDATYPPGLEEQALRDGHSTPLKAAEVAKNANAGMLALVHLPYARYGKNIKAEFLKAAREIFPNTIIPEPGEIIELG